MVEIETIGKLTSGKSSTGRLIYDISPSTNMQTINMTVLTGRRIAISEILKPADFSGALSWFISASGWGLAAMGCHLFDCGLDLYLVAGPDKTGAFDNDLIQRAEALTNFNRFGGAQAG